MQSNEPFGRAMSEDELRFYEDLYGKPRGYYASGRFNHGAPWVFELASDPEDTKNTAAG